MDADVPAGITPGTQSDDELLAGARRGDAEALEALLVRYQPRLFRFGLRMCGNEDVEWSCYYASSGGDTTQGRFLPVSCRTPSVEFSESCAP